VIDRRRKLTAAHFVDAAIKIAAERGIDGISMREIAARTGTTPMAAYHHVGNRANLIRLTVDRIGGTLAFAASDAPWDDRLRTWAHEIRRALGRYPGTARWLQTNPPAGPNAFEILEVAVQALAAAGLDDHDAADCYAVLTTWVLSRCDIEDHDRLHGNEDGNTRRDAMTETFSKLPDTHFAQSSRLMPIFVAMDPETHFDAGLEVILDGIRARADKPPTS
jgi:AcrR family transcriptional regulator